MNFTTLRATNVVTKLYTLLLQFQEISTQVVPADLLELGKSISENLTKQ